MGNGQCSCTLLITSSIKKFGTLPPFKKKKIQYEKILVNEK